MDRATTKKPDDSKDYLKLLLTTAGHSEEWALKNLESVIWLLKCAVELGGVNPTPGQARGFRLADVDEVTLRGAIEQHREVHEYGQYLREAMRLGKGATLKYPGKVAAELLLCFLVREMFQRTGKKEIEAAGGVDKPDEGMNEGTRDVEDSEEEMEYVRKEFEQLRKASGKGGGDGFARNALLQEAAKASSWLQIQETPWKSVKGSEDEEEKAIRNFGFIFTTYRPSCWWFELFEMTRKFMMVGARLD